MYHFSIYIFLYLCNYSYSCILFDMFFFPFHSSSVGIQPHKGQFECTCWLRTVKIHLFVISSAYFQTRRPLCKGSLAFEGFTVGCFKPAGEGGGEHSGTDSNPPRLCAGINRSGKIKHRHCWWGGEELSNSMGAATVWRRISDRTDPHPTWTARWLITDIAAGTEELIYFLFSLFFMSRMRPFLHHFYFWLLPTATFKKKNVVEKCTLHNTTRFEHDAQSFNLFSFCRMSDQTAHICTPGPIESKDCSLP